MRKITVCRPFHRRRRVKGIAPLELLLVFPVLLVLGGMILCYEMVVMHSMHKTMQARSEAWAQKGGAMESDLVVYMPDVHVMSPMLPNWSDLPCGVIHREKRDTFRLSLGYVPRTAQIEEHHYLLDDCWTHERLTQYRGHGRMSPEPSMMRFVTLLNNSAPAATRYLPESYGFAGIGGVNVGAFASFPVLQSILSIPTLGFANPGTLGSAASALSATITGCINAARLIATELALAQQWAEVARVVRGIQQMVSAQYVIAQLRAFLAL